MAFPIPGRAAETIHVSIGPIGRTISIESLETFAQDGQLSGDLRTLARVLEPEQLDQIRQLLQQPIDIDAVATSQLTYSPLGEDFLERVGTIIQTEAGQNGFHAVRAAAILAADSPEGLTVLSLLRHFPTDGIRVDIEETLEFAQDFFILMRRQTAALEAIAHQAEHEILATGNVDFTQHSNLQQFGPYSVEKQVLTLTDPTRSSPLNPEERQFGADLYLPQSVSQPAPVIAISHGLGSQRAEFTFLAEHLASHGFAVVVPDHVGSDTVLGELLREGQFFGKPDPVEFIDRPQDITFVLDELERLSETDPTLANRMSLDRVGIIGHSFGGYTALALAAGEMNQTQLNEACIAGEPVLNLSLLLQCQAVDLPQPTESFRDPRIAAVMALNPVSSTVLGQESLSQIDIPVMMVQASQDVLTPMVPEQLYPFSWLTTSQKYLVTMLPGGHGSANQTETFEDNLPNRLLTGPNTDLGSLYTRALSVAFMQVHVGNQLSYDPYLSAAYAAYMSQDPLQVNLITSSVGTSTPVAVESP